MGSAHSRSALHNQIHALIFDRGLPSRYVTVPYQLVELELFKPVHFI